MIAAQQCIELRAGETDQFAVPRGEHRGGAALAGEEHHLADALALGDISQDDGAGITLAHRAQPAAHQDEHVVTRIAFVHQSSAPGQAHPLHHAFDFPEPGVIQRAEEATQSDGELPPAHPSQRDLRDQWQQFRHGGRGVAEHGDRQFRRDSVDHGYNGSRAVPATEQLQFACALPRQHRPQRQRLAAVPRSGDSEAPRFDEERCVTAVAFPIQDGPSGQCHALQLGAETVQSHYGVQIQPCRHHDSSVRPGSGMMRTSPSAAAATSSPGARAAAAAASAATAESSRHGA
jgi:hypothetical protein